MESSKFFDLNHSPLGWIPQSTQCGCTPLTEAGYARRGHRLLLLWKAQDPGSARTPSRTPPHHGRGVPPPFSTGGSRTARVLMFSCDAFILNLRPYGGAGILPPPAGGEVGHASFFLFFSGGAGSRVCFAPLWPRRRRCVYFDERVERKMRCDSGETHILKSRFTPGICSQFCSLLLILGGGCSHLQTAP